MGSEDAGSSGWVKRVVTVEISGVVGWLKVVVRGLKIRGGKERLQFTKWRAGK